MASPRPAATRRRADRSSWSGRSIIRGAGGPYRGSTCAPSWRRPVPGATPDQPRKARCPMASESSPVPIPVPDAARGGILRHPVNVALRDESPRGARIADAVTGFMGSWRFILVQTVIVLIWIVGNIILLFHFDPYPFILLNLAFSTQ